VQVVDEDNTVFKTVDREWYGLLPGEEKRLIIHAVFLQMGMAYQCLQNLFVSLK
jgi:hypothetical protein